MSKYAALLLAAVIGYLLGSVSTGILYSRSLGRDIRTQGSKNSGATNMTRVHGPKEGGLTFLGDCLKGVLAALIGKWLGGQLGAVVGGTFAVLGLYSSASGAARAWRPALASALLPIPCLAGWP